MNDNEKKFVIQAVLPLIGVLVLVYFFSFGGSLSHRKTFIGRLFRLLTKPFDYYFMKVIPPFAFLAIFLDSIYIHFAINYRVFPMLTRYPRLMERISPWVIPIPLISYILVLLVNPGTCSPEEKNGKVKYCMQIKQYLKDFDHYSKITYQAITKRNSLMYTIFLLSTLISGIFFTYFTYLFLAYQINAVTVKYVWTKSKIINYSMFYWRMFNIERHAWIAFTCATFGTLWLLVAFIDQFYLLIRRKTRYEFDQYKEN